MKAVEASTSLYCKLRKKAERQSKTVKEYVANALKKTWRVGELTKGPLG